MDYDSSGPSVSPTLTMSPTSSPLPSLPPGGVGVSISATPTTATPSPSTANQSKSSQQSSPNVGSSSQATTSAPSLTPPFPKSLPSQSEPLVTFAPPNQIQSPPTNVISSPSPTSTPPEVKLRRRQREAEASKLNKDPSSTSSTTSSTQSSRQQLMFRLQNRTISTHGSDHGRLLKDALDLYFESSTTTQKDESNEKLDAYVSEVFRQLDYHKCGTISREDFDILCEVLNISHSPLQSYRNSGIEWLSTYKPRPNSPVNPLRLDKLGEVKYRNPRGFRLSSPPPEFLYTIGPRPFWELWPHKKRKRKRLTIDDFKRSLLEQWAKHVGLNFRLSSYVPPVKCHEVVDGVDNATLQVVNKDDLIETVQQNGDRNGVVLRNEVNYKSRMGGFPYSSRSRRILSRLRKLSRRSHILTRVSRNLRSRRNFREHEGTTVKKNDANLQQHVGGSAVDHRVPPASEVDGSSNIEMGTEMSRLKSDRPRNGTRSKTNAEQNPISPTHTCQKEKSEETNNNRSAFLKHRKVESLEQQVSRQREEIIDLKEVVQDLRSSLQLSDAQNLALQVILRKMAKAEVQLPLSNQEMFRAKMNESEKQLENLVKELKEMSQVRYPTYNGGNGVHFNHNNNNHHGTNSSSGSTNNFGFSPGSVNDQSLEEEIQNTSEALGGTRAELAATEKELKATAFKLKEAASPDSPDNNSKKLGAKQKKNEPKNMDLGEAYKALERAQEELNRMR